MPFMGGASLEAVSAAMKPIRVAERTGRTIADALMRCRTETTGATSGGPAFDFLAQATYIEAVCWTGACLAEALHFAHQRGLVHFDIKPSNLLLASDGQPMLLDFHLARGPIVARGAMPEWIGGTQPYMPPEQAAALAAVRGGQPVETAVDARADIYSLALVLDELLGGEGPLARPVEGTYGLRHINPHVTRGLADILAKCLSLNSRERYADAHSLADDLRRHLADLPLRGVANRSPLELWRKWRRRRPRAAMRFASSSIAFAALAGLAWFWAGQRIDESQQSLLDGQQLLDRQAYSEAIDRLQRGLDGLRPLPGASTLKRTLRIHLASAQRLRLAHELHQFVERLRFLDGGSPVAGDALRAADQTCRVFWATRDRLLAIDDAASPADSTHVQADLLDLVVFWLDIESRLPQSNESVFYEQASALLDQADAALGANEVLERERRFRLGGAPITPLRSDARLPAVTQRYALARSLLRSGDEERALEEFRRAVKEEPQEFWANYYRGRCAYRLELYDEALNAFSVCVALAPTQAECYFNRALVFAALQQTADALDDYDRALKLDPSLAPAAVNRDALRRQIAD
jgi:tetratricopeptide (TPR) repeat protein